MAPKATTPDADQAQFERLKYEHKETLELGKYFYSTIFGLAPITFVFNGALLYTVLSVVQNGDKLKPILKAHSLFGADFAYLLPKLIGALGVIFNLGACSSFLMCSTIAYGLTKHFKEMDRKLKFAISGSRNRFAERTATLTFLLTTAFLLGWIVWWAWFTFGMLLFP